MSGLTLSVKRNKKKRIKLILSTDSRSYTLSSMASHQLQSNVQSNGYHSRPSSRLSESESLDSEESQQSSTKSRSKKTRMPWKFTSTVRESNGHPIFSVSICPFLPINRQVFAVTSSNTVSIYECVSNGTIGLDQSFADPDEEEKLYACTWALNRSTNHILLIAAGLKGVIRVINTYTNEFKHLKGHSLAVNDLKTHPKDTNLLLSASKDHSLRLWNLQTDVCIAVFGGVEGHRDEVLSADFHWRAHKIVSCGMDHSLKIWSLEGDDVNEAIASSYKYNHLKAEKRFKQAMVNFPNFTTRDIHRNYVDCVSWFGDLILSKSCENNIVCWKPGTIEQGLDQVLPKDTFVSESTTTFIHQFEIKDSEIWFMRFCTDNRYLVLGNTVGKTYVWDIETEELNQAKNYILSHPKCTFTIRQTAISKDGSILLAVADNGSIWRWDKNQE